MPPAPFANIPNPSASVTTFSTKLTFPESLDAGLDSYTETIELFGKLVAAAKSTNDLLKNIRDGTYKGKKLIGLLKMFRRCVSPVCDTERSKKLSISSESIIASCGNTFKSIDVLKAQFQTPLSQDHVAALAVLLSESDGRGQSGYALTAAFFDWFETQKKFSHLIATGPRGAGADIQLSKLIAGFEENYPTDMVIADRNSNKILAAGFARYDATRGGSQSDDRTAGNANKADKARVFFEKGGKPFRLLFLSDGPGLLHNDTWREACALDGQLNGAVRVTTLKLAPERITLEWLEGRPE